MKFSWILFILILLTIESMLCLLLWILSSHRLLENFQGCLWLYIGFLYTTDIVTPSFPLTCEGLKLVQQLFLRELRVLITRELAQLSEEGLLQHATERLVHLNFFSGFELIGFDRCAFLWVGKVLGAMLLHVTLQREISCRQWFTTQLVGDHILRTRLLVLLIDRHFFNS